MEPAVSTTNATANDKGVPPHEGEFEPHIRAQIDKMYGGPLVIPQYEKVDLGWLVHVLRFGGFVPQVESRNREVMENLWAHILRKAAVHEGLISQPHKIVGSLLYKGFLQTQGYEYFDADQYWWDRGRGQYEQAIPFCVESSFDPLEQCSLAVGFYGKPDRAARRAAKLATLPPSDDAKTLQKLFEVYGSRTTLKGTQGKMNTLMDRIHWD